MYSRIRRRSLPCRPAFTLVELLVVIAIIAVLAALIFPVFARVRSKSKEEVCASNLRQVYMATTLYTQDYDGVYPYAITPDTRAVIPAHPGWSLYGKEAVVPDVVTVLQPYSKSREIFHCPLDTERVLQNLQYTNYALYGISYYYDEGLGLGGFTLERLPNPSQREIADDVLAGWHTPDAPNMHARRGNVQFVDGHCKSYVFQDAETEYIRTPI